jgi:hypothetical protein
MVVTYIYNGILHLSYQGEECGCKVHSPILINGLVHPDELLEGQPVRALAPAPQGRVHVLQHVVHLGVIDSAPR